MQTPNRLERLLDRLEECRDELTADLASELLRELPVELEDVQGYLKFESNLYARHTVKRTDQYELLVVCWGSGQRSTIHDHKGSICCFRILTGLATELHFEPSAIGELFVAETEKLARGDVQSCNGEGVHQILNLEKEPLISMHVYSPPLTGASNFSLQETTFGSYTQIMDQVLDRARGGARAQLA